MSIKKFLHALWAATGFIRQAYGEPVTLAVSKAYPEQSARQQRPKYYTVMLNGRPIMQRMPRHEQLAVQPSN